MKKFLGLFGLLVTGGLGADQIAVFAKGDFLPVDAHAAAFPPNGTARIVFLDAFQHDLAGPAPFAAAENLATPPAWGRPVPGASGRIQYHPAFAGGFVVTVTLAGLLPDHRYILCLNGNPARAGNEHLVDSVAADGREKYYDFFTAATRADGGFAATFGVALPAGPYDVRLYVKDTADFKIVLFHDFFKFTVE
jgi:hypothetical protein